MCLSKESRWLLVFFPLTLRKNLRGSFCIFLQDCERISGAPNVFIYGCLRISGALRVFCIDAKEVLNVLFQRISMTFSVFPLTLRKNLRGFYFIFLQNCEKISGTLGVFFFRIAKESQGPLVSFFLDAKEF